MGYEVCRECERRDLVDPALLDVHSCRDLIQTFIWEMRLLLRATLPSFRLGHSAASARRGSPRSRSRCCS